MNIKKVMNLKEDYLDSAEYRVQRYEDEIPELFNRIHDAYMTGMVNAKAYADALATIYDALNEIDIDTVEENLQLALETYDNDTSYSEEYDDDFDDLSSFENMQEARVANNLYGVSNTLDNIKRELRRKLATRNLKLNPAKNTIDDAAEYIMMGSNNYSVDQWIEDTLKNYPNNFLYESIDNTIDVGSLVTYVDDNPPTRGIVVKKSGDIATVQVGDASNKDYVEIPISKLQLDEAFASGALIDMDSISWKVADLLSVEKLGEDKWIEFTCEEPRGLIGSNEKTMRFEAVGETGTKRGYIKSSGYAVNVVFRNGSEARCNSVEEIARFVAGEFGVSI